jgi:hypothetical protein
MKVLRLFLYKLLTQAIIILGRAREKLGLQMVIRKDRTFVDKKALLEYPSYGIINVCCDCGLAHRMWLRDGDLHQQPERPREYDYSWRRYASPSSPYSSEYDGFKWE